VEVLHIVPRIHAEASGPSYSVPRLCAQLAALGASVSLHALNPPSALTFPFPVYYYPSWSVLPALGISPAMRRTLRGRALQADILHNHSLWMMPNVYPYTAVAGSKCRLVCSPRGTLSEWALNRSRWPKKIMWLCGQASVVKKAACLHATSEAEYHDIRRLGLHAPVAVVPNGIDLPEAPFSDAAFAEQARRLLFLGRIHPKKGLDLLLPAWRRVQDAFPEWELHIVGEDNNGYRNRVQELARSLGARRVTFSGPVYGAEKGALFSGTQLYVLPTYSENFGLTVAESLAHAVPAIVTKGAPWQGLEQHECGWWPDISVDSLAESLRAALHLSPNELHEKGRRGRAWMEREFSWPKIGQMMQETYQWVLGGGCAPPWVRKAS
jgi:glycosyltransferase involved in cell wall biosynthesis